MRSDTAASPKTKANPRLTASVTMRVSSCSIASGLGVVAGAGAPSGRAQQVTEEPLELGAGARQISAVAGDDAAQVRRGVREIIVDDHVVEFRVVLHVSDRLTQPPRDHLG